MKNNNNTLHNSITLSTSNIEVTSTDFVDTLDHPTPLIFNKKQKKSSFKSLLYIDSDTGKMRHYPPAAQEWYNSIYTFNKNYSKSLPAIDKSLMSILNSYSNMIPGKNSRKDIKLIVKRRKLTGKNKRLLLRKLKATRIIKHKRLTPRKVFVGKGDLKHTSNKVIITLYNYNILKTFLLRKIKRLIHFLYFPKRTLTLYITKDLLDSEKDINKKRNRISYNRPLSLREFLFSTSEHKILRMRDRKIRRKAKYPVSYREDNSTSYWVTFYEAYLSFTITKVKKITKRLGIMLDYFDFLTVLVKDKIINKKEKLFIFTPRVAKFKYSSYNKRFIFSVYRARKLYLARLLRFSWALYVNNLKFKDPLMVSKLKPLVRNLYGKDVVFNLVELKKMHLNSDIFTQAIALKLKNRNNKLFNVLRSSLSKINLPNESRINERFSRFNKENYIVNKIRNTNVSTMFENNTYLLNEASTNTNNITDINSLNNETNVLASNPTKSNFTSDSLNGLLQGFFPSTDTLQLDVQKRSSKSFMSSTIKLPVSVNDFVIKNLKHLKLAGVRLEARGRLTRRFTAERSVYKMKYKGGLKNVDSSFKGLPAVLLRGFLKSNVQYSIIHSKNRIGAYGIKGWVGNK